MSTSLDFETVESHLAEAEFQDCRTLWYSSNYVYIARLCHGPLQLAAVYKPESGEMPLWDFPTGKLYRREVAAYRLSRFLGWNFVPPTVERDGPHGPGSVQLFIDHDPESHFFTQREDSRFVPQLLRMVVFDYVANNADRKGGHCLLDEQGQIWGIDHGLCFHTQYKMRTVMWDWAEDPIPDELLEELDVAARAIANNATEAQPFLALVEADEVAALLQRAKKLLTSRRFPAPGPHRSYPWPLV